MADVGYIAIVVAGFGAYWWNHLRPRQPRNVVAELFTPDAEVALHVATHEATSRHQDLSSLHVLYGLLQDETVTAAITAAGGTPDALEDRVLAALVTPVDDAYEDVQWIVNHAAVIAHRAGRQASCTDLWAFLGTSHAARLVDDSQLDRGATLFVLFHGGGPPDLPSADERDVFIVLRNDHYTTQEFVCGILRDVFALSEADASTIMMTTHTTGRAVVGRFTAAAARTKIGQVRAFARAQAFPLWIGVEPA
ncbi:MAG TPA: ATP-dependent Clp protease adaptor ClpS [Kofleriaceae bacterium]|nr:ATP-dependent Clp protease adaptor ClpS [Kofleriaceae bacterium]